MNLQRIRYFLALCDTMHFTNAARQLKISQPALTKAIATLEEELGTRLIRREGKHTHLTKHGESAQIKYTEVMSIIEKTEIEMNRILNDHAEHLRIAVLTSLDFTLFAGFLVEFHRRHPRVFLDIIDCTEEYSADVIQTGNVDCLLTTHCERLSNRAKCINLYEESNVVVGGEALPETTYNQHAQATIENKLTKGTLKPDQLFSFNSGEYNRIANCSQQLWIRKLVKAGTGYGISHDRVEKNDGITVLNSGKAIEKRTISAAIPIRKCNTKVVSTRDDSLVFNTFRVCSYWSNWR